MLFLSDVQDVEQLFDLLLQFEAEDADGKQISLNSFTMGMMRLTGTARCTDLTVLINELLEFKIDMQYTQHDFLAELKHQHSCLAGLYQALAGVAQRDDNGPSPNHRNMVKSL